MAVVTSDLLAAVLTTFRALFATSFEAATNMQPWRDIAMQVNSTGRTETYNWFGTVPTMKDVTHQDLETEGLFPYNFSIENLVYKAAIEVERSLLEDDRLNLVTPRVQQLGLEAARHPGQLVFQLFETNGNAYDGVAFFANTRVLGRSANIDNNLGGAGVTVANIQTDLAAARTAMRLFQDDQGRPMNLLGNVIVCPAALEQTIFQALNANQGSVLNPVVPATADGTIRQVGYSVLVNPYLTDVDDWFLLAQEGVIKPFIWQNRVAPTLEGLRTPETEEGIRRDKFLYSARARYAVGYGDPRHAVRIVN